MSELVIERQLQDGLKKHLKGITLGEEEPCPVGAFQIQILTLEEIRDQCNKPRSIQEFLRVGLLLRRRPHRKPSTEAEADVEL